MFDPCSGPRCAKCNIGKAEVYNQVVCVICSYLWNETGEPTVNFEALKHLYPGDIKKI
jgi:hypothetical protein